MATERGRAPQADKLAVPDVLNALDVNRQKGLTSSQAQSRLAKYDPTRSRRKEKPPR